MGEQMKILITGGSGFIGRNLVEFFSAQHEVIAPSHRELDLSDREAVHGFLRQGAFDVVIHAACKPGHRNAKDPFNICYVNSRIFFNLYENRDFFGQMLVTGSGAIYDQSNSICRVREEQIGKPIPSDEHGLFRFMTGRFIEQSGNIVDLRLFGVFGRYEDYAIRFISNAICKALHGLPITLRQNRRFDYIYIDDFCRILQHLIDCPDLPSAMNLTPDESVDLLDLAFMVRDLSGRDVPIQVADSGYGFEYSGDNGSLREILPEHFEFTPIRNAVVDLIRWYEANFALIDRAQLLIDK